MIRRFARRLGFLELAAGNDITAVESTGFASWGRVQALGWGLLRTLGQKVLIAAVYDRDYWSDEYIGEVLQKLNGEITLAHVHHRKEVENYLLIPSALSRALIDAVIERKERGEPCNSKAPTPQEVDTLLADITDPMRSQVQAQYIARRQEHFRRSHSKLDAATIAQETLQVIEGKWPDIRQRMEIVPGKEVLASVRQRFRSLFSVNVTDDRIVRCFRLDEIPQDLRVLVERLEAFRKLQPNKATRPDSVLEGGET